MAADPPATAEPSPSSSWPAPHDPKPTVLLIHSHTRKPAEPVLSAETWSRLHHLFTIRMLPPTVTSIPAFVAYLDEDAKHVRAILRTGWLKTGPHADLRFFDTGVVPHLPPSLELVTCSGHGHDAADVAALAARGIAYANTPDTCTEAVANTGLHLVLSTYRYFSFAERCARGIPTGGGSSGSSDASDQGGAERGRGHGELSWPDSRQLGPKAEDPCGQVLGIVGMGDIGTRIAVKCAAALGMRVAYYNRRRNVAAEEKLAALGCAAVYHDSLEGLLREADCLCLACPLTKDTRGMFGKETLRLVKASGVRIVNIARGGLIDEEALIEAMDDGRVLGVGLDVHANEPGVNPKLRDNWMTTLLPHIGVCSNSTWREFDRVTFENLEAWFYGDRSKVPVVNF